MKNKLLITLIILGNYASSYAQEAIGINTELPRTTLDVNGKVTVRDTGYLPENPEVKPLYVNTKNGLIGTVAPAKPTAAITVFAAENSNILPQNEENAAIFNQGNVKIHIPISSNDADPNNLNLKVENNKSIIITEDGTYQINAYFNVLISSNHPNRNLELEGKSEPKYVKLINYYNLIFLLAQISHIDVNNKITEITGTRPILTSVLGGQSNIITLPTVTKKLKAGEKLELSFSRTTSTSNNVISPAGDDVTKIGLGSNFGAKPYSISITKL